MAAVVPGNPAGLGASPALAANDCGSGSSVTCTSSGNPYAAGITYNNANQQVTVSPGVVVTGGVTLSGTGTQTLTVTPGTPIVDVSAGAGASAIDIEHATSDVTISAGNAIVSSTGNNGVVGQSTAGDVSITIGAVTVPVAAFDGYGVIGISGGTGTVTIDTTAGTLATAADGGFGVYALTQGTGAVMVTTAGVTTTGNVIPNFDTIIGIMAESFGGTVTVDSTAGTVSMGGATTGDAIDATAFANTATVTTAAVSTKSDGANAIRVLDAGVGALGAIIVDSTRGTVSTQGASALGIDAESQAGAGGGAVKVTTAAVSTKGAGAIAIKATTTGTGANGVITIDSTKGKVSTEGDNATAITASSLHGTVGITTADVSTLGRNAVGILGNSGGASAAGLVSIDSTKGTVSTGGDGADGISVDQLTNGGVTVHAGAVSTKGVNSGAIHVTSAGAIEITSQKLTTTGNTSPQLLGINSDGIYAATTGAGALGAITIDSSVGAAGAMGSIEVSGDKTWGIRVTSGRVGEGNGGAIDITAGDITVHGNSGNGIDAFSTGNGADGKITVNALGTIHTEGDAEAGTGAGTATAILAVDQGTGNVSVTTHDVLADGDGAGGVFAQSSGGNVLIDTTGGTVTTKDGSAIIGTFLDTGGKLTIRTGDVNADGFLAFGVIGLNAGAGNLLSIDTTAGTIHVGADSGQGIEAISGQAPIGNIIPGVVGGPVEVTTGDVTSEGDVAVHAESYLGTVTVDTTAGLIKTLADGADGIDVSGHGGAVKITTGDISIAGIPEFSSFIAGISATNDRGTGAAGGVTIDASAGTIDMTGASDAIGIWSFSQGGPISITAGNINANGDAGMGVNAFNFGAAGSDAITLDFKGADSATGLFGMGALVYSPGSGGSTIDATIEAGASLMGGWQAEPSTPGDNGAAAGLVLGATAGVRPLATHVNNAGSIGALSDLAIATADLGDYHVGLGYGYLGSGGGIDIENSGTITGYVMLGAGANIFDNISPRSFDLRNFADTNGDGVRDTERVAVSDFGGPGASFTNGSNGILRLLSVPGAATIDTTGQILGDTGHDITAAGIEQGQLLHLQTFTNTGTITMMDGETGGTGPVAGDVLVITGGGAPGSDGGGVFVSNGGSLRLDTVLGDGVTDENSDLLVVDSTEVGSGGATKIFIANAGGAGAKTSGDGIQVVSVLDSSASAAGAFVLGGPVAAGGYNYGLFQGGLVDPDDGDWYLRSNGVRDAAALYAIAPSTALLYGNETLATYRERVSEPDPGPAAGPHAGWLRLTLAHGSVPTADAMTDGAAFSYSLGQIEAGLDLFRAESDAGSLTGGVYLGSGTASAGATGFSGASAGSLTLSGATIGAYGTFVASGGAYLDAVAQATFFDRIDAASAAGDALATSGTGLAASLEGGVPIPLGPAWTLTPEAQLVWQQVNLDAADDDVSSVSFPSVTSFTGRVGARLETQWNNQLGQGTLWLRGSVVHPFSGKPAATLSDIGGANPVSFVGNMPGDQGVLDAGVSEKFGDRISGFASAHAAFGLAGGSTAADYGLRLGFRIGW